MRTILLAGDDDFRLYVFETAARPHDFPEPPSTSSLTAVESKLDRALAYCALLPLFALANLREKSWTNVYDCARRRWLVGDVSLGMSIINLGKGSVLGIRWACFEPSLNLSKTQKWACSVCLMMSKLEHALRLRCRTAHEFKSLNA